MFPFPKNQFDLVTVDSIGGTDDRGVKLPNLQILVYDVEDGNSNPGDCRPQMGTYARSHFNLTMILYIDAFFKL